MTDTEVHEVRQIRREISQSFGNDIHRLVTHYQELENQLKASGSILFREHPLGVAPDQQLQPTGRSTRD